MSRNLHRYNPGTKFQLVIADPPPNDPEHRIELGIRIKEGVFDRDSNYVAILLPAETVRQIIFDLAERIK